MTEQELSLIRKRFSIQGQAFEMVLRIYLEKYNNNLKDTINGMKDDSDNMITTFRQNVKKNEIRSRKNKLSCVSLAVMKMDIPDDILPTDILNDVLTVYLDRYDNDTHATIEGIKNDLDNMINLYRQTKVDTYNKMSGYRQYNEIIKEECAAEARDVSST
jgi:hypothetical protein